MTHRNLHLSARKVLSSGHLLDNPIVLFQGKTPFQSEYAILAFQPVQQHCCYTHDDIRNLIQRINRSQQAPDVPTNLTNQAFRSGWMGYFSYQAGIDNHQSSATPEPLAEFFEYPLSIELRLDTDECILHNPRDLPEIRWRPYIEAIEEAIASCPAEEPTPRAWAAGWNARQYQHAFNQTHQYLQAGDCYQVNLAMPFHCHDDLTACSPLPLFERFQPSFGAYLRTAHATLFSVSPERFIRIDGHRIETRPIKGTIARSDDAALDAQNRLTLAASRKNQAENLMIVDLLRNDLSRHAEPFSVKVDELFHIETHANVHHMVSTISAVKRADVSMAEVILDALPGGSITGAPKRRAMEIIAELEAQPRGPYCGSLGYFDDAGYCDFNILIRTIVARPQGAVCWGGGGVVIDSTWEDEWQEIHTKVQRILDTPL